MTTIKNDTFTVSGGNVALESWVSTPSGGGYGGHQTTDITVIDADDEVESESSGSKSGVGDENPSEADQKCSVNGRTIGTATTDQFGSAVRTNNSGNKDTYVTRVGGDGSIELFKVVNNTYTQIETGSSISGFSESTYYDVRTEVEGSTLRSYVDDTEEYSDTDTDLTAAENISLYLRNANARITSLFAEDFVAAGGDVRRHIIPAYLAMNN